MTTALGRRIVAQHTGGVATADPVPTTHALKLLQIWQWEGWPCSFEGALDLCEDLGFTGLLIKALDGKYWMGDIDSSPIAVGRLHDCQALWQLAYDRSLYCFFWTNPRQSDVLAQATLTAAIASVSDGVLLDIEPYDQFWGAWAPVGLATQFMQAIRQFSPYAYVGLQPDPRTNALAALRINEWTAYADSVWGQHYWSDFGTDPEQELMHAEALSSVLGLPVLPTLPGNYGGTWPTSTISTFPGFAVWRAGSTPTSTLIQLGALPVAGLASTKIARRP